MVKIIERSCKECGNLIKINRYDVQDVVAYKHAYYHKSCFIECATNKIQKNNRYSPAWEEAFKNI